MSAQTKEVMSVSKIFRISKNIRKASADDIPRIAEILVFSKRKNYRHIFNDDIGSFVELQVCRLAKEYADNLELLNGIFVYDDEFVKGIIHIDGFEIKELYVEPFFENRGIGGELIEFAKIEFNCSKLWVLAKNERARKFYRQHGFHETEEVRIVSEVPDSDVLEIKMVRDT